MNDTPNPGSDDAVKQGCRCAVLDNNHGEGYRGKLKVFAITDNCPLHGLDSEWGRNTFQAEKKDAASES